jgi:MarR family transcriptional regulator for hemolysin
MLGHLLGNLAIMPPPARTPIGRQLARSARAVSRAFDKALAAAGGSVPVWLVLISLKTQRLRNQRELADAVGIREATLTHHLNLMDSRGLITRRRDPANRRVHLVELTPAGEAAFDRLRAAAAEFDRRLRSGLTDDDLAVLERLLGRLEGNAASPAVPEDHNSLADHGGHGSLTVPASHVSPT